MNYLTSVKFYGLNSVTLDELFVTPSMNYSATLDELFGRGSMNYLPIGFIIYNIIKQAF